MDARAIVAEALSSRGCESPESLDSLQLIELLLDIERNTGLELHEGDLEGPRVRTAELEQLVRKAIEESGQ
jgi:acyl carrier protein